MGREALWLILRLAAQAPRRFRPLSSNVREHIWTPRTSSGLILASIDAAVVAWVPIRVFSSPQEPAWPMYWNLAAIASIPAGLLVIAIVRTVCNLRPSQHQQPLGVADFERQCKALPKVLSPSSRAAILASERKESIAWYRARDFENFWVPFFGYGVGGILWWYFAPQLLLAAYQAARM